MHDEAIATLEMIEQAVAKSTSQYGALKKRAEDIYEVRIAQLVKEHGCSETEAHGLAGSDPVASRAYRASVDLAEKQSSAIDAGGRIAAYLD